jgi:hypothetical protein
MLDRKTINFFFELNYIFVFLDDRLNVRLSPLLLFYAMFLAFGMPVDDHACRVVVSEPSRFIKPTSSFDNLQIIVKSFIFF